MTSVGAAGSAPEPSDRPGEPRVTLLTRTACHLCEPVRAVVTEVCSDGGHTWREVNVDSDPDLRSEYGDQVPVVLVDGAFLAAYQLDADTLSAALGH
jgi:hypothetical protein